MTVSSAWRTPARDAVAYLLFLVAGLLEVWLQWNRNFDLVRYGDIANDLVLLIPPFAIAASVLAALGRDATLRLLAGGFVVVVVLQFFGMYHDWTTSGERDGVYGFTNGVFTAWGVLCVIAWPLAMLGRERKISGRMLSWLALALLTIVFVILANAWRPERQAFGWPPPPPWRLEEYQLAEAAHKGDLAHVKELLEVGARIDSEDAGGWTPLMFAVESGQEAVVRELLARGADPDSREYVYGRRLSYYAIPRLKGPANGSTALMIAAVHGHVAIATMLLDAGADPHVKNEDGRTALDLAQAAEQSDVVELLR